jgi:hypothetical protein
MITISKPSKMLTDHLPHVMNLPQPRFVHAALAVEQDKPSGDVRAFLHGEEATFSMWNYLIEPK